MSFLRQLEKVIAGPVSHLSEEAIHWLESFIGADPGQRVWGDLDVTVPEAIKEELSPYRLQRPTVLYRGLEWSSPDDYLEDMEAWDFLGGRVSRTLKEGSNFPATYLGTSSWTKELSVARDFAKKGLGLVLKATIQPQDTLIDVTRLPAIFCRKIPAACKESEVITISDEIIATISEIYVRDHQGRRKKVKTLDLNDE